MRKLMLFTFVLLTLAIPVIAQESYPINKKSCYTPSHKNAWLKFSFTQPVGQLPTAIAFDPAPLKLYDQNFGSRAGVRDGGFITDRTLMRNAFNTPQDSYPWGVRLRMIVDWTPLVIDVSWTKGRRSLVQVFSSEFVTVGWYYEHCPSGTSWCVDYGGKSFWDSQYNEHDINLHVFRAGVGYELFNSYRYFSIEPAIGIEWSVAWERRLMQQLQSEDGIANAEVVRETSGTTFLNGNRVAPYASLSADVYPLGRKRFLSIGITTRYLLSSGDWTIRDDNLLGAYEIPIRSNRWATSFQATLILPF